MKSIFKILSVKKVAMAVPVSSEQAEAMKQHGIFVLQDILKRLPHTTQKDMFNKIQEVIQSGASEFFRNLEVKTAIQLPAVYVIDPDDIFSLNGKNYFAIEVDPARKVGKKWTSMSGREYQKNDQYDGEVLALDIETGLPVPLPLPQVNALITAPTGDREKVLERVNKEVASYNERIQAIDNAVGASKLALQIARAEDKINERIETLNSIKTSIENKLQRYESAPRESYEGWMNSLREGIRNGQLNIRDVYDTILFLYQSNPESLAQKIRSGEIIIPEDLKAGILGIAEQEQAGISKDQEKKQRDEQEREERIRQREIPEIHEQPISPFAIQDIPGSKYKTVKEQKSFYHWMSSQKHAIEGTERDIKELTEIKNAMEEMRKYTGPKSKEFITSPEGRSYLQSLSNFLNASSMFIKRYATDIIQDGKVNPKLMGSEGTEGNAFVAVALTRLYNVIKATLEEYTAISPMPSGRDTVETPVPALENVSNTSNSQDKIKITKLSEILWKAFEERLKIK